jgi:hypothetical protein
MTAINAEELKALKGVLVEMTVCLQRMDEQKEQMKAIAEAAEDKFEIKKKIITKMGRTMYNRNYNDIQEENKHFEFLYEAVVGGEEIE